MFGFKSNFVLVFIFYAVLNISLVLTILPK